MLVPGAGCDGRASGLIPMTQHLVVVESPAKARTIKKYLGSGFEVLASYGHVRDLVPREGAVEPSRDFEMHYEPIEKAQKHLGALGRAMKKADALYLATDPDREGEAIAWHVAEMLRERKALDTKPVYRVVFHEITRRAIQEAVENARDISMDLVNAQQARRALDYLVGFNLSPLLWKKIRRGLSAGRVQSPALRMIVEREDEIERFRPREYWSLDADLDRKGRSFTARLTRYGGNKLTQFSIARETDAQSMVKHVAELVGGSAREPVAVATAGDDEGASAKAEIREIDGGRMRVFRVEKKQRRRNPPPPFMTSTLQQEAVRKLGFSAQRTMRVAQQLYEGIEIDGASIGLITYMRTDSLNLAAEAREEIRAYIRERFGPEDLPVKARVYKTRSRNAQEAHEAIRPTSAMREPGALRGALSRDQHRLYQLVWKRAIACQMQHALIDTVGVDLSCGDAEEVAGDASELFRATGSTIARRGFLAVYDESTSEDGKGEKESRLPPLAKGDIVEVKRIRSEQHFTEPPPRFSEATLIRALEEYGIGRPSTYATIIQTLKNREYVELEGRRFHPTDIGRVVNGYLTEHFSSYVEYEFTARLEDDLDAISRGEREWKPLMREFWTSFEQRVKEKEGERGRPAPRELGVDPKSGRPVTVRMGRYGPHVQIGTSEDEEKPIFAGLRPGQRMNTITLQEGLLLFRLPRSLGETPDGEPVSVGIGRFGPYVRFGSKFASIGPDDDPYQIGLERALSIIDTKKKADAARHIKSFEGTEVQILNGRYGPYVTDRKKNARVPKGRDPSELTLEECRELLDAAPARRPRARGKKGRS